MGKTSAAEGGTTSFPIAFSVSPYSVVLGQAGLNSDSEKYTSRVKSVNKSSLSWHWGNRYESGGFLYFVAIGK